ncbi:MAG: phosphoglycolate phosphatase [Gammaproteobacteria bacterium]|nr:phosphoglycolate phosphatase [Gammaproteobacteria bacterium]MCW8909975.1 phosphoglycolate phosphatase [Gammaproteobacteria bacterium]MCW9005391.1 phosphoglycolate phosphatase [Gammaproteobacteria bacterium]MCW9055353.1 phosphoglycolate phosphatase [Gammaproteobacteria bacterium]
MIKKPSMVLIDVDGTLVDSVPDLAFCVDEMMKQLDMPVRGEDVVRHWVGNGVERLVRRALINQLDGEPDEALFQKAIPIFEALYAENTSKRSCLYPGVQEALDFLKTTGVRIGCVTNKASQFTLPILKDLGISGYFEMVLCGDELPRKKPDPMPLLHVAEKLGVKPEQSLMLGDSMSDVKAARAAGFDIICMSYGYNHGEDIRDYNPDAVVDSMDEIKDLIDWS